MCRNWVQFVSNFKFGLVVISRLNNKDNVVVHKLGTYTKLIRFLYRVYTSSKSLVLNLLPSSLYTLSTPLIITRAFLSNLFFIINNMGVKV